MLTDSLVPGTYQQYKQDTNHLTDWLSRNAISCGYDIKHLTKNSGKKQETQKYTVSARDIKVQAELIARCTKPRIVVPTSVLRAAKDAIEARKMCYSFYSSHDATKRVANKGHMQFIATLEVVLDTLEGMQTEGRPVSPPESKTSGMGSNPNILKSTPGNQNKKLERDLKKNKFHGLEVEESATKHNEWISHIQPVKKVHPNTAIISAPVTFEVETTEEEEKHFELLCFFKDLCEVRSHLRAIWTKYKNGELSLIVVSALTNIAINSIKDMEEELAEEHGFADLECRLFAFNHLFNYDDDGKIIEQANGENSISSQDFQEFKDIVGTVYNFLHQYEAEKQDRQEGLEGFMDIKLRTVPLWSVIMSKILLSKPAKVARDHERLSRFLMEATCFLSFLLDGKHATLPNGKDKDNEEEDMISQGLRSLLSTGQITIWTILAFRFYLDAQSALGNKSKRPYQELLEQAKLMSKELNTKTPGDDLKGWMGCPSCVNCGTIELRRSANNFLIFKDNGAYELFKEFMFETFEPRYSYVNDQEGRIFGSVRPSEYFEQNMLYCGTMSLSLLLDLEMIGIDFERRFAAIQTVAHLYHASRFLQLIEMLPIPELDNFIQKQSYLLFGTAIPKTFKAAYDCLLRSTGASVTSRSREEREHRKKPNTERFRAKPSKSIRPNRTFDFLRQHCHGEASMRSCVYNLRTQNGLQSPNTQGSSSEKSNLVSLLQTLSQQLSTQLPEVNKANYWTLANKCIWALSLIRMKLNHEFSNQYCSDIKYSEQSQAIVRWFPMVANILQGAGEAETGDCLTGVAAADRTEDRPACHCCGLAQLRTALEVLTKVWAFTDKKLEDGKKIVDAVDGKKPKKVVDKNEQEAVWKLSLGAMTRFYNFGDDRVEELGEGNKNNAKLEQKNVQKKTKVGKKVK